MKSSRSPLLPPIEPCQGCRCDITSSTRSSVYKTDANGRPVHRLGAIHPNDTCRTKAALRQKVLPMKLWIGQADTVALAQSQWTAATETVEPTTPLDPGPSTETPVSRGRRTEVKVPSEWHSAAGVRPGVVRRASPNRRDQTFRSNSQP